MIYKLLIDKKAKLEAVALTCVGLPLLLIAFSRLIYPFDLGHYEACIWTPALLTVSGSNPYGFATQEPYVMAPYGYLYYWIIGIGLKIFGYQFWVGRALSLLATAYCLFCIVRITRLLTQQRQSVFVAVLAFLSLFPVQAWVGIHRPDLPSLALALTGVWISLEELVSRDIKTKVSSILIVLCLAGAFFFKQTIILPVFVIVALYCQRKQYKKAFSYTLMIIGMILLIAIILNQTSEGGYYSQHFILTREVPYDYLASAQMIFNLVKGPVIFVFLAMSIAIWVFYMKTLGLLSLSQRLKTFSKSDLLSALTSQKVLIGSYFLLAIVLGLITSSRRGANINYYLEAALIGSIAMALVWDSFVKKNSHRTIYVVLITLVVSASAFQLMRITRGEYYRWQSLPYYKEIVSTLEKNTEPGTVCISAYPELATFAGREYHFGDWIQYNDGRSDKLRVVFWQAVGSKKYSAIIWPDVKLETAVSGYQLIPMKSSHPQKFYSVYLFVNEQMTSH